jgi:hypothetical protein
MIFRHAAAAVLAVLFAASPALAAREPVKLAPRPGTELDTIARTLTRDDLAQAVQKGDAPLVLVAEVKLGSVKQRPALFVQLQSARECGSAGCNTTAYLERGTRWDVILDSIGGSIEADTARHGGMRDLVVDHTNRWTWNGKVYVQTRVGPKARLAPPPKPAR